MNGYKMQITHLLVIFVIVVQQTLAREFPKFIKKCQLSDPEFDDCVFNSAKDSLETVFRGNEKYGIEPMATFSNKTMTYNISKDFSFTFINHTTNYNQNLELTYIHFDFPEKLLHFGTKSPEPEYSGRYEAGGEILGKPVHESGTVNITFDYVEANATVTLDFKMKHDKKYLVAVSCVLVAEFNNYRFLPYDYVTDPMTTEQMMVYLGYIGQLPDQFKRENEEHGRHVVRALNAVFEIEPFEEIFIP